MKTIFFIPILLIANISFSQGIQSEKYFLFENMCDSIYNAIDIKYGNENDKKLDLKAFENIVRERTEGVENCSKEYVAEILKTRYTYPYRIVNKNYVPLPNQTELLYVFKHYNITDENINTGFAEQYPYKVYDSLMFNAITIKYGDSIFAKIKKSCDSLTKKGKGFNSTKLLGRKQENKVFKGILNGMDFSKIKCGRRHIFRMTIDSLGRCNDIQLLELEWHGRTMPSNCVELEKLFASRKEKLKKLKWKPAEFEGVTMESELTFSFDEFEN